MESVTLKIYAKINPFLSITGIKDGYHELDTVFCSVSLYDTITATKSKVTRVLLDGVERNQTNAYKAAELMKELGAGDTEISITRGILSGGGVGSSSADGAGVIRAMQALYGLSVDDEVLKSVAIKVGSDVPYMLFGGWARLRGTGKGVEFLSAPTGTEILLAVKGSVNTGECFRVYDQTRDNEGIPADGFIERMRTEIFGNLPFYNALYAPATRLNPFISQAISLMRRSGLTCSMTGSGAIVFGTGERLSMLKAKSELEKEGFTATLASIIDKGYEIV